MSYFTWYLYYVEKSWRKKMAVLFNEKEFEELILKKAKEIEDPGVAELELKEYKKADLLEYLFYVYRFCKVLKENNILYLVRYGFYPSYMMEILGVDDFPDVLNEFPVSRYDNGKEDIFQIYIPNGFRDKVIELFSEITNCSEIPDKYGKIFFVENGKYHISLIQHTLLYKLSLLPRRIIQSVKPYDNDVINFMFEEDKKGYYMSNLYGCVIGNIKLWDDLISAAKPKRIKDFQIIYALRGAIFTDINLITKHIKEYGLGNIIYDEERFYEILCDQYDIDVEEAKDIKSRLNVFEGLNESHELILKSSCVPDYIIEELNVLHYLPSSKRSLVHLQLTYCLAYIKFYYRDEFLKTLPLHHNQAYVGPFFFIDNIVHGHLEHVNYFEQDLRFFDSQKSHLDFFDTLFIDGDYGNYPRGRVVFDNYNRIFIVYLDKSLMTEEIENSIKYTYCLLKERVVFKSDPQYTHDGL